MSITVPLITLLPHHPDWIPHTSFSSWYTCYTFPALSVGHRTSPHPDPSAWNSPPLPLRKAASNRCLWLISLQCFKHSPAPGTVFISTRYKRTNALFVVKVDAAHHYECWIGNSGVEVTLNAKTMDWNTMSQELSCQLEVSLKSSQWVDMS